MKVKLLRYTPDGEKLIASAGKLCYSKVGVDEIEENITEKTIDRMVRLFSESGHHSPLEHVSFTFGIEGVSRTLTHQLVRHRIASYSQQSQRYVTEDKIDIVFPDEVAKNKEAYKIFYNSVKQAHEAYEKLIKLGIDKEDARYLLPNATETKIVVTMNARTLIQFFRLRCCERSQSEIREMATEMLRLVQEVYPIIFNNAGPACLKGKCPEGSMSCGKQKEVKEKFDNLNN